MKIIDNRSSSRRYGELEPGSVFEMAGRFYIKTNIPVPELESCVYSVNLATGETELWLQGNGHTR